MLSVIIPALNSASTISSTLTSIFSNTYPRQLFEVIVVDNGSSDNTVEVAKRYPVTIYHCQKRGIGPPKNLGLKMAKGNIVCFTESDCVVEADWLKQISTFLEKNPAADGVGGPVFPFPKNQNEIQGSIGKIFMEGQQFPKVLSKVRFGETQGLIYGTNSAYRKKTLATSGGFSEPGGSNLEVCWRLTAKGRNLLFNPDIIVFHRFPTDLRSFLRQQFRWGSQQASMEKEYLKTDAVFKGFDYAFKMVATHILFLWSPNNHNKMLKLTQRVTYFLGRINGFVRKQPGIHRIA